MHFLYKVLSLSLFISYFGDAFTIKSISSLENILSTKAITNAIYTRFNHEVINENLFINNIILHNTHIETDILYFLVITYSLLYASNTDEKNVIKKLEKFERFSITQRRTSRCLLILFSVFTRSIDNAI